MCPWQNVSKYKSQCVYFILKLEFGTSKVLYMNQKIDLFRAS